MSPPTSSVKSAPSDIVEPFIVMSSTVRVVKVPKLVMFVCAAVDSVPAMLPDPSSTTIVFSVKAA